MLPTFSVNNKQNALYYKALAEVKANKPLSSYSSKELDAVAGFIIKKATGEISENRTLNSFIYNYDRDELNKYRNKVMFSELEDVNNSVNNGNSDYSSNNIDSIIGFTEIDEEKLDFEFAKNVFTEYRELIFFEFGYEIGRLLYLGLQNDKQAIKKFKDLISKLKEYKGYTKYSFDDFRYSLGILLLDDDCIEAFNNQDLTIFYK